MSVAVVLVGYVGLLIGYESFQQHRLSADWDRAHPAASVVDHGPALSVDLATQRPHLADGQPLARLRLSSVGFDAIVTEGSDSGVLSSGPGHEDHTAYPGEGGLVLFSNHNGFSLSWGDVKVGDGVVVEMSYGRYRYTITDRSIVSGGDSSILHRPHSGEVLYLSTCWPLWQGAFARDRLVFQAVPAPAQGARA
jgi:sortase A